MEGDDDVVMEIQSGDESVEEGGHPSDGLPNIERQRRGATPAFLTARKPKINGPDVVVPGSNVPYADAVTFAYRDVLLQRQVPQSEVKYVEVVRKVRERYPGAWEGQLESSCVHLMKTAYKKAGKKVKEESEQLSQSGKTGRRSELLKAMREIVALDQGARTRTPRAGKKKKGKPSVVDALVMASFQARREQGLRPEEEGSEDEEVEDVASKNEEVEVKEEAKPPLALSRPLADPSVARRELFEKGKAIRDASLEKMRNERKGKPRTMTALANMSTKSDEENVKLQTEMKKERLNFDMKMEDRKQAREEMREKKEIEEKERRERKDKEEKEEKERRESKDKEEKERRERKDKEEKEEKERKEIRREENDRERRVFLQQQVQSQRESSLVTTALLHKIIGGPLQPGVEPTATGSVEIQLVDQEDVELNVALRAEKSSFKSFNRELKAYAKVENHEGLVVQGPGERLSMITSLNLLPDGDRLNLSVITKYGKTYLKLASG